MISFLPPLAGADDTSDSFNRFSRRGTNSAASREAMNLRRGADSGYTATSSSGRSASYDAATKKTTAPVDMESSAYADAMTRKRPEVGPTPVLTSVGTGSAAAPRSTAEQIDKASYDVVFPTQAGKAAAADMFRRYVRSSPLFFGDNTVNLGQVSAFIEAVYNFQEMNLIDADTGATTLIRAGAMATFRPYMKSWVVEELSKKLRGENYQRWSAIRNRWSTLSSSSYLAGLVVDAGIKNAFKKATGYDLQAAANGWVLGTGMEAANPDMSLTNTSGQPLGQSGIYSAGPYLYNELVRRYGESNAQALLQNSLDDRAIVAEMAARDAYKTKLASKYGSTEYRIPTVARGSYSSAASRQAEKEAAAVAESKKKTLYRPPTDGKQTATYDPTTVKKVTDAKLKRDEANKKVAEYSAKANSWASVLKKAQQSGNTDAANKAAAEKAAAETQAANWQSVADKQDTVITSAGGGGGGGGGGSFAPATPETPADTAVTSQGDIVVADKALPSAPAPQMAPESNKTGLIIGVLAVAAVGFYLYKRQQA